MTKNKRPPVTRTKINQAVAAVESYALDLIAFAERFDAPLTQYQSMADRRYTLLSKARHYAHAIDALTKVRKR